MIFKLWNSYLGLFVKFLFALRVKKYLLIALFTELESFPNKNDKLKIRLVLESEK